MTTEERVLSAIKRKNESNDFYRYAEMLLWYFPLLCLPAIREFWKYAATPSEIRASGLQYALRATMRND